MTPGRFALNAATIIPPRVGAPRARVQMLICALAGVVLALAFEFEALALLAPASIAVLFSCAVTSPSRGRGAMLGFIFGLACFGLGLRWLFWLVDATSAPWLAAVAPAVLVCAMALVTAVVGAALSGSRHANVPPALRLLILAPAVWTLLDALRHQGEWAFPWFSLGYSQAVASPLSVLFPVGGVLAVGWATALAGGALALAWIEPASRRRVAAAVAAGMLACAALWTVPWSHPLPHPVRVAVVQGNIGERKFDDEAVSRSLATYESLIRSVQADAIVLPESALPLAAQQMSGYLSALAAHARRSGVDVLVGAFEFDARAGDSRALPYFSSAIVLGASGVQVVRKRYLVPFGEWLPASPLLTRLYARIQRVPHADLARGAPEQPLPLIAGGRVAVMICYEDLFGDRLRADAAHAGWVANLANDSWGESAALRRQHARIAQARAREFARPMMRAADTGRSGWIDARGRWVDSLAEAQLGALEASLQPRAGTTPYMWVGDRLAIAAAALLLLAGALRSLQPARPAGVVPPTLEVNA